MSHPIYLGEQGTEQFTVEIRVNGELIKAQPIHDPFIHNTTVLRGFGHAWRALFGGILVQVNVSGSMGAERAVMTLNPVEMQKDTDRLLEECRISREANGVAGYYETHDTAGKRG